MALILLAVVVFVGRICYVRKRRAAEQHDYSLFNDVNVKGTSRRESERFGNL